MVLGVDERDWVLNIWFFEGIFGGGGKEVVRVRNGSGWG